MARGLSHSSEQIFFCVSEKGIMKINIQTEKIDKVYDDGSVDGHSHINTDGIRICFTSHSKHTITVLGSDNRVISKFEDENLFSPLGISMDQHQNICVDS